MSLHNILKANLESGWTQLRAQEEQDRTDNMQAHYDNIRAFNYDRLEPVEQRAVDEINKLDIAKMVLKEPDDRKLGALVRAYTKEILGWKLS